ncbi:MAG: hypothetical protein HKO53_13030 [Gemmatimonadetes bacterium]|nr:hypothetical protein [Gemmatimonadota bacterium]
MALLLVGDTDLLQGQAVGDSLRIRSVVPERVLPGQPAHLHLEGIFPSPNRTLLTRLRVMVDTPRYSCELGWREEAVRALVEGEGLPWLVEADLFSGGEMDVRRQCGTIDGVWEDKIEVTLRHPALLRPGSLTVEVALTSPGTARGGGSRSNHRIDLEVGGRLHVVGHLPDAPVADPGRDLLLALVLEGGPPEEVDVLKDGAWVPVLHRSDPTTSRLTVLPEQYAAPGRLVLRLRKGREAIQTQIPVCIRASPLETRCPPPPSK